MSRPAILETLRIYGSGHPEESGVVAAVTALVRDSSDCLDRRNQPGHLTASAWVFDATGSSFLLTHHRKLDRWLQIGGHADGDADLLRVARREVFEESGLEGLRSLDAGAPGLPVDLDIHQIPARPGEPEHWHHDFRFVLVAPPGAELRRDERESKEMRWFPRSELTTAVTEESMLRLARKAERLWTPAP